MTEFNAGDKVRYDSKGSYPNLDGLEGVVTESNKGYTRFKTTKSNGVYDVGTHLSVHTIRCTLIGPEQKPFGFEDIQVGDTIRRTKTYNSGATEVREGTVASKGDSYAACEGNFILAYVGYNECGNITYELLDRPKPKHWTQTKPVGSIGIGGKGHSKTVTKVSRDKWHVLYHDGSMNYMTKSKAVEGHLLDEEDHFNWVA